MRNKILTTLTSVLLTSCGASSLPIFVGGNGDYDDSNSYGYKDGVGIESRFRGLADFTIDKDGNLFVSEIGRIRKVTPEGKVSNFAGNGEYGYKDGKGSEAIFKSPVDINLDSNDMIYVSDLDGKNIRKVTPEGEVSTLSIKESKVNNGKDELVDFVFSGRSIKINKSDEIYLGSRSSVYIIKDGIAKKFIS